MCQVHTGAYVSLLAPGKTDYIPLATQEPTYILHVVPITIRIRTTDASQLEKKKQRKAKKIKERKEKTRKRKNEKGKERKEKTQKKQEKTQKKARKDKKRKQEKEKKRKMSILADPRNWLKTALGSYS